MKSDKLKPQQTQILKTLLEHDYFLTTSEIARMSRISWNTAKKDLELFNKNNWIGKKVKGNREYWRAFR